MHILEIFDRLNSLTKFIIINILSGSIDVSVDVNISMY